MYRFRYYSCNYMWSLLAPSAQLAWTPPILSFAGEWHLWPLVSVAPSLLAVSYFSYRTMVMLANDTYRHSIILSHNLIHILCLLLSQRVPLGKYLEGIVQTHNASDSTVSFQRFLSNITWLSSCESRIPRPPSFFGFVIVSHAMSAKYLLSCFPQKKCLIHFVIFANTDLRILVVDM